MAKKVILLMLILPLLVMIILFTTTNRVSLAVDIKVDSVEFNETDLIELEYNQEYKLNYTVYPTSATNKNVKFTDEKNILEVNEEGILTAKGVGSTTLTIETLDGNHKDSLIVDVYTNDLLGFDILVNKTDLIVGESIAYKKIFNPEVVADDTVQINVSNPNILEIDSNNIKAKKAGKTTVEFIPTLRPELKKVIEFSITNEDILDISDDKVETFLDNGKIQLSIDTKEDYKITAVAFNEDGTICNDIEFSFDKETEILSYKYLKNNYNKLRVSVTITLNHTDLSLTKSFDIKRTDISDVKISFNQEVKKVTNNITSSLEYKINPSNVKFDKIEVDFSNDNLNLISHANQIIKFEAKKLGLTVVTITGYLGNIEITSKAEVVIVPRNVVINNANKNYGIENIFTIGGNNINNKIKLDVTINGLDETNKEFFSYITNNDKVSISKDGYFKISGDVNEIIEIKARYGYKDEYTESKVFKVRVISNASNVYSYNELNKYIYEEKNIVLQNHIIDDFGKNTNKLYEELKTTYDYQYYTNVNKEQPKVKILLPLRSNIEGNGYKISADNVTNQLDATGALKPEAIFKGPLDFVRAQDEGEEGIPSASVKAQDNIVLGLFEGANINNLQIESISEVEDLADLNYAGTTVEVLGDNVNITNCRLYNGRTVLRIFGDEKDPNKNLNVNIKNSILGNSREFTLRVGSNKFYEDKEMNPEIKDPSPYLPEDTDKATFPRQDAYNNYTDSKKQEYTDKFISHTITLDNVAFDKSGIFSIGLDSHFSGPLLQTSNIPPFNQFGDLLKGWERLAKTSYGVKLIFKNEIRIYDWKDIANVDSSTLIEVPLQHETFDKLKFDVATMIKLLADNPLYSNIIYNDFTYTDYVHGGIAFFGGGKNYSIIEYSDSYNTLSSLKGYKIALKDAGQEILEIAAGTEPFYFMLNDKSSSSFTPHTQKMHEDNGTKFDFIMQ